MSHLYGKLMDKGLNFGFLQSSTFACSDANERILGKCKKRKQFLISWYTVDPTAKSCSV